MSTIPERQTEPEPAQTLTETQQRIWRHWVTASAQLPAAITRELQADAGLSMPDFEVLSHLTDSSDGRARVTKLALALSWEKGRASHHLTRMERRGLVARQECHDDGRGSFVAITPDGRSAFERATPGHVGALRSLVFSDLTPAEVRALESAFTKVLARLDAVAAD